MGIVTYKGFGLADSPTGDGGIALNSNFSLIADYMADTFVLSAGTTGQYLRGDLTWQSLNAAAVGAASLLTNSFTGAQSIASGTITSSAPSLDVTQTWNSSGTTFTALRSNVTNTASASGSLLIDLQVGGTSKFKVDKTGAVTATSFAGTITGYEPSIAAGTTSQYWRGDKTWQTLPVTSVAGRTGAITLAVADVSGAAPLASPTFTGTGTGVIKLPTTTLSYASTITPVGNAVNNVGTLTGNVTIASPGGSPADYDQIIIRFTQDSTGRTFTWNSIYAFGTDVPNTLFSTAANWSGEAVFRYNSTASKWRCLSVIGGF